MISLSVVGPPKVASSTSQVSLPSHVSVVTASVCVGVSVCVCVSACICASVCMSVYVFVYVSVHGYRGGSVGFFQFSSRDFICCFSFPVVCLFLFFLIYVRHFELHSLYEKHHINKD